SGLGDTGTPKARTTMRTIQECNWTLLQEELFLFVEFVLVLQVHNTTALEETLNVTSTLRAVERQPKTKTMSCGWCMLPIRALASTTTTKKLNETIWGGSPFYEHALRTEGQAR